jgi:type VI secretion system protein
MRERTLVERLRDPRGEAGRSTRLDTEVLADSVLVHLRRMMNTRQGISATVPDYGMPDMTDVVHAFPEAVGILQRSIRHSIEKYEPRLRQVSVTHVPDDEDPFHLRFEIRGQLDLPRDRATVAFTTTLEPSGHAHVRR